MARNVLFSALVTELRNELGRSTNSAVGVEDVPRLKYAINKSYEKLAAKNWPHLRKRFDKITLNAGQRFYDFPSSLDSDRIEAARLWWNGRPQPVRKGISIDEYALYDSIADERCDPVLRWDVVRTDSATQFEVWPVPASTHYIQFQGFIQTPKLVNDGDVCLLDDQLVVTLAAARLTADEKDRKLFLSEAQDRLMDLFADAADSDDSFRIGLDEQPDAFKGVRINVTSSR